MDYYTDRAADSGSLGNFGALMQRFPDKPKDRRPVTRPPVHNPPPPPPGRGYVHDFALDI